MGPAFFPAKKSFVTEHSIILPKNKKFFAETFGFIFKFGRFVDTMQNYNICVYLFIKSGGRSNIP
jgi:hypothetical protein